MIVSPRLTRSSNLLLKQGTTEMDPPMTHPTAVPAFPTGKIPGYPRIDRRRELKKAVKAFWAGSITAHELETRTPELRAATRERLASSRRPL